MRKVLKRTFLSIATMALVAGMASPGLAGTWTETDENGAVNSADSTIEPILVKSTTQVYTSAFRTTQLGTANIRKLVIDASGGSLKAHITTKDPIFSCAAIPCAGGIPAPYGGVHLMILFRTDNMYGSGPIGCANAVSTPDPNAPGYCTPLTSMYYGPHPSEGIMWYLYYGATLSEQRDDWGFGQYDPSGRIVGAPLEPGVGQTFGTYAQNGSACSSAFPGAGTLPAGKSNNVGKSISADKKTLTLTLPYTFQWRANELSTFPCGARSFTWVDTGENINDIVAFSWMDHEIGGPEPIGLIFGWTWYTDSVPALQGGRGYSVGTPSGDPNTNRFALSNCPFYGPSVRNTTNPQLNPLYNGLDCTLPNPLGPGFTSSNISVIAQ